MKVSQLAKEQGLDYKDVMRDINEEFGTSLAHFSAKVKEEHAQFIRRKNSNENKESDKVEKTKEESSQISWDGMPWDKTERARTKGHLEWREKNPEAWQAYIAYERIQIKEERNRYIKKMRG